LEIYVRSKIGHGYFEEMQYLDDFTEEERIPVQDIIQFVEFNAFNHSNGRPKVYPIVAVTYQQLGNKIIKSRLKVNESIEMTTKVPVHLF